MSTPEKGADNPATNVVPVKKRLRFGRLVVGAELGEQGPMYRPFSRFTAQRPVVSSGSRNDFFENRDVLSYLSSIERVAQVAVVPHVTVLKVGLVDWVMDRYPELSVAEITGDLRRFAGNGLPPSRHGHISKAQADGNHVQLKLDSVGANRLQRDFAGIREHFGVPTDEYVGRYAPHVSLAVAPNGEVADELVEELNAFIKPEEGDTSMPVAFGSVTVISGRS